MRFTVILVLSSSSDFPGVYRLSVYDGRDWSIVVVTPSRSSGIEALTISYRTGVRISFHFPDLYHYSCWSSPSRSYCAYGPWWIQVGVYDSTAIGLDSFCDAQALQVSCGASRSCWMDWFLQSLCEHIIEIGLSEAFFQFHYILSVISGSTDHVRLWQPLIGRRYLYLLWGTLRHVW